MLKKYQDLVSEIEALIVESTQKSLSAYGKVTMLSAEVGELADDVIALEGDRVEDKLYNKKDELAKELVDVLFNTMSIANHYKINLDDYFVERIGKIRAKF